MTFDEEGIAGAKDCRVSRLWHANPITALNGCQETIFGCDLAGVYQQTEEQQSRQRSNWNVC